MKTIKQIITEQLLPISEKTLRRLIYDKKIKAINYGTKDRPRWFIEDSEIERFKKSRPTN